MPEKLRQMRQIVREELEHIPSWPEPQGELRMMYWARRMHSLGKKAKFGQNAKEVLEECITHLGRDYGSNYKFEYDKIFFDRDNTEQ